MKRRQNKNPVTFTETEYRMYLGGDRNNFTKRQRDLMSARQHREVREWMKEPLEREAAQ